MLLSANYLVLLLLLPVTVFIIIPLLMFVFWITAQSIKAVIFASNRFQGKPAEIHIKGGLQPSDA